MEILLPFVVLVVLFVVGVPIAFAMAGAGMLGCYLLTGDWLTAAGLLANRTAADFVLVTIPMFILMAYFTAGGGIARDLYTAAASSWGTGAAACHRQRIRVRRLRRPVRRERGCSRGHHPHRHAPDAPLRLLRRARGGGARGGGDLDALIPPSVGMVLYAVITETSVGKRLIAGIVPGILLGLLLALTIWIWVTINPALAPPIPSVAWPVRRASLLAVWPSMLLVAIVLYIMYSGIATPTEAGSFGAVASALIGFATRRLSIRGATRPSGPPSRPPPWSS